MKKTPETQHDKVSRPNKVSSKNCVDWRSSSTPSLGVWYIFPRLISCVSVTSCSATLSNLAYQLTGRQSFLLFDDRLGFRVKKAFSDLATKEKGPCSAPLQTDESSEKQHLGNTHINRDERKKLGLIWLWKQEAVWNNDNLAPLVIFCRHLFLWCGGDCSAGINQTCEQMASYSSSRPRVVRDFFIPEMVIGLLFHGPGVC